MKEENIITEVTKYPRSECSSRPGRDVKQIWIVVRVRAVVGGSGQCAGLITVTGTVPSLAVLVISEIKHW